MERAEAGPGTVRNAGDAVDLVRFAPCVGARVAVWTGAWDAFDADAIVVRADGLDRISVCARSRIARVGAGVSAGELSAALAPYGLISSAAGLKHERVADLALTGGIGWFARKYGMVSDDVVAFEMVDADANLLRASAHENEDLFWALSGGGAGFGLVTAVEVQLHAEPDVCGGTIVWPAAAAAEVMAAMSEVAASASEGLSVRVTRAQVPGTAATVSMSAAFLGPEEEARVMLKPFAALGGEVLDTCRLLAPVEIGGFAGDPVEPVPGRARAAVVSGLDDILDALDVPDASAVQVRQLGGRLAEASTKGPHGALEGEFAVFLTGPAARREAVTARTPLAWLGAGDPVSRAFGEAELGRLREIKAAWDPNGVFVGRCLD
ncbi:FAD/FMN-containing dehydrogenase [Catenulispora sp. GP43]|uniref:FAD-binding oxidoreductase n=1 Tax=Catenulispora sp. GP43 TaxID=3156263 RepID=UPI0035135AA9